METVLLIFIGLSIGAAVAGAISAFLVTVGPITRMAIITGTEKHAKLYESIILWAILIGTMPIIFDDITLKLSKGLLVAIGLFSGIFVGVVAISLVEILDVIPIIKQRLKLKRGLKYLIFCIAIGKMLGSLVYWIVDGFGK